MATIAEQIEEKEAELALLKAQLSAFATSGVQNVSIGGMAVSKINYRAAIDRRTYLEKSLQRLYRGGRGMILNMGVGQ